jgi:(2Fe-2S) ferredoxin
MDKTKGDFKVHVFICTNQRDKGKECCADQGADGILKQLKEWSKQNPEWRKRIRINSSGCIDRCSEGVAIAMYPQNQWLVNVSEKNIDEVKKKIEKLMAESD